MTLVGRGDPGRDVDEVVLLDGRWPTRSGEIVLSADSSIFATMGLVMSVLIVGNVVASAVGTGTCRIGILKAVGFTPAQVVRAYVGQALIPAAAGTAFGVLAGHLLAVPVLAEAEEVYGTSSLTVAPWVDLAVIAGVLCLVAATAWASARLAGRHRGRATPAAPAALHVASGAVRHTPSRGRSALPSRPPVQVACRCVLVVPHMSRTSSRLPCRLAPLVRQYLGRGVPRVRHRGEG